MPQPAESTYPKHQRWRFIQRFIAHDELLLFANSIVKSDGKNIDNCLPDLLSFLNPSTSDISILKTNYWHKIWSNLMHQMGLGYTIQSHIGNSLRATDLAHFLSNTENIRAFYYYWGLKFQYPFGFPKHKHYVENSIAIQPVILILQHQLELHRLSDDLSSSYLTNQEIVQFLMKSTNNSDEIINDNCQKILDNRAIGYSYESEAETDGFYEAAKHFFSRGRLFMQNIDLLSFNDNMINSVDEETLSKIQVYLSYSNTAIVFSSNSRDMRNSYFNQAYSNLDIDPIILLNNVDQLHKNEEYIEQKVEQIKTTKRIVEFDPEDIAGTFSQRTHTQRNFQHSLRTDLLVIYENKCCICGLDLDSFLIASHIVPVRYDPGIAADPRNCLLLCVLHDRAFDKGYFGIDDDYKIRIKNGLSMTHPILVQELIDREGQNLLLPSENEFKPLKKYLRRHRLLHQIT